MELAIFDLDGVIVDTAKYHYLAWKRLAEELEIPFTLDDNERLKGVSRMRSLQILLELGGRSQSAQEKERLAARKKHLVYAIHRTDGPPERNSPRRSALSGCPKTTRSQNRLGLRQQKCTFYPH